MSAVGNFQMYVMNRMAQAEEAPAPAADDQQDPSHPEAQVDPQVLHNGEAWFAYRHGCG